MKNVFNSYYMSLKSPFCFVILSGHVRYWSEYLEMTAQFSIIQLSNSIVADIRYFCIRIIVKFYPNLVGEEWWTKHLHTKLPFYWKIIKLSLKVTKEITKVNNTVHIDKLIIINKSRFKCVNIKYGKSTILSLVFIKTHLNQLCWTTTNN